MDDVLDDMLRDILRRAQLRGFAVSGGWSEGMWERLEK